MEGKRKNQWFCILYAASANNLFFYSSNFIGFIYNENKLVTAINHNAKTLQGKLICEFNVLGR